MDLSNMNTQIKKVIEDLETEYMNRYMFYKIADFYDNDKEALHQHNEVKAIEQNLRSLYYENNLVSDLNNNDLFGGSYQSDEVNLHFKQLQSVGIQKARNALVSGKRNRFVKQVSKGK